jgi:hypothetical protein
MDQDTIQKIAIEIARHLPSYAWMPLLVGAVLMAIAGAVGAFLGEYLKTRGKNLATKADFEALQDQLRANTELVETIKSDVGQKDWARREWTNLRRIKLEALFGALHDCEAYLDRLRFRAFKGKLFEEERDPELRTEVHDFSNAYREECVALSNMALEVATTLQLDATRLTARDKVQNAARKVLLEIMGVD